ncbi:MAG: hypothetical protein QGI68_09865 [Pseudomonadales bacterium]|jgi:hypothetical protein|nr:hypothetical protein [Pseudomonadales bacterium]MDP7595858.1 hypothetical protein [Pseudomonadales bacterium]
MLSQALSDRAYVRLLVVAGFPTVRGYESQDLERGRHATGKSVLFQDWKESGF